MTEYWWIKIKIEFLESKSSLVFSYYSNQHYKNRNETQYHLEKLQKTTDVINYEFHYT